MKIPVYKPLLPTTDDLIPYLRQIDANRYYSNLGPLAIRFEEKLAAHFGVEKERVVTSANGTLALVQMLKALNVPKNSICITPSWTFIATPSAAVWADMVPHFADVDRDTWAMRPHHIEHIVKSTSVGAVIPVIPFGYEFDVEEWESFREKTGIPVIIDAAAAFDSRITTTLPYMVSLHATKMFGVGEGAVVIAGNQEMAKRTRMFGNFGFYNSRESTLAGTNAKLNEYSAALGLASFDLWPQKRQAWIDLAGNFSVHVDANTALKKPKAANNKSACCYGQVILPDEVSIVKIQYALQQDGIGTIRWWGKGCHTHDAYKNFPKEDLSATEAIAKSVIGLPFWLGITDEEMNYIFASLKNAINQHTGNSI